MPYSENSGASPKARPQKSGPVGGCKSPTPTPITGQSGQAGRAQRPRHTSSNGQPALGLRPRLLQTLGTPPWSPAWVPGIWTGDWISLAPALRMRCAHGAGQRQQSTSRLANPQHRVPAPMLSPAHEGHRTSAPTHAGARTRTGPPRGAERACPLVEQFSVQSKACWDASVWVRMHVHVFCVWTDCVIWSHSF